jgi:hypothetical protein
MVQPYLRLPLAPLQRALVARLRGDATLAGLLAPIKDLSPATAAVVDQPAEGQAKPYVRLGDHLSIAEGDHTSHGRVVTETLHVWTQARSNAPGQVIADRIAWLLDHQTEALSALLVSDGHRCVRIVLEYDQALTDPDPQIRHHVLRFRVETTQLS